MENKTKILIVDDHPIVRHGLMQFVNQEADLLVCGEAETAEQGLEQVEILRPDLVIVDLSLGDTNGLQLIKTLHARNSDLPILVLSMHDEFLYVDRSLRAGARGYVMKHEATELVLVAIREILKGEIFVSGAVATEILQKIMAGRPATDGVSISNLSERELEVFQLIGKGQGTRQIAEQLELSVKTIESYRTRIKEKLNLASAPELARRAVQWVESQYW